MRKLLEVCEFDTITCNADYQNDNKMKYLTKPVFDELVTFIHEFTTDSDSAEALDFMRVSVKHGIGNVINIKNYVGLIQLKSGFQIQILPKISFDSSDTGSEKTKKIFLKMLRSMKDFPAKQFRDANLKVDRMNLYELFINMYLQELRGLVKHGIKSGYVSREDNLNYYKGKLQVGQHIRLNMAHGEKFYVSYDEFHPNRPENKLLKATLVKLQKITGSMENAKEIRQLLSVFETVEASTNYEKDFSLVTTDRSMKDYEILLKWSKVFLMNRSFTTFTGEDRSRALLFPMESVYESYVAKQMVKIFSPAGWDVSTQDKGHYLFEVPKPLFALRPDIVIKKDNRTIIMDTKWKRLIDNERKNYGISQADMYQMYAYSKKYETPEIWLLYPLNEQMKGHADIEFVSADKVHVHLFFVDVANIEDSLNMLLAKV